MGTIVLPETGQPTSLSFSLLLAVAGGLLMLGLTAAALDRR